MKANSRICLEFHLNSIPFGVPPTLSPGCLFGFRCRFLSLVSFPRLAACEKSPQAKFIENGSENMENGSDMRRKVIQNGCKMGSEWSQNGPRTIPRPFQEAEFTQEPPKRPPETPK